MAVTDASKPIKGDCYENRYRPFALDPRAILEEILWN